MRQVDYIIVGGGSAGSVLADRLSADGRFTVLLLEAGGDDRRLWLQVPIGYGMSFYDPQVNWMYRTAPDPGLDGREGYWPRGRVLGGSSTINAMVYMRGLPADFDDWRAQGNFGWGWHDVEPYFRRLENFTGAAGAGRGRGGPVTITEINDDCHPTCQNFLSAAAEIGLPPSSDFNGPAPEGVGLYQITTQQGRRVSAARAYLWPARHRPNLDIETDALVLKIDIRDRRADGVTYRRYGVQRTVSARREVILAAGAVNSPQLLLLSGVGPAQELRALGIAPVIDAPAVGRHLQDHLCIDHLYRARVPTLNQTLGSWRGRIGAGLNYLLRRRGPLSISVNQGGGLVRTIESATRPDMQLYFSPLSYTRAVPGVRALMRPDRFPGFLLSAQPCRPLSRGRISLRAPDPDLPPLIEPNSLSVQQDVDDLLAGSRLLRRLAAAPSLAQIIEQELKPGLAAQSDDALIADIRARASCVFHPVGTCRMGPDPTRAVVDQRLLAHGLTGLRIVDASIFPAITSANTNAPVMMVAEKAADLVLADHAG